MIEIFENDNDGYLKWTASHRRGFVVNIQVSLNTSDARLHRADCRTMNGQPTKGKVWTGPYIKYCSESLPDLDSWTVGQFGEAITRCGICKPPSPKSR